MLRNILTVYLNNGATRADLRGIPKHCEMTAKAGRQSTIYTVARADQGSVKALCQYRLAMGSISEGE